MADGGTCRRVVVTGMGAVTPIGHSVADLWEAMRQGRCGVAPIERFYQNDPHFLTPKQIENFDLGNPLAAQIKAFDHRARLEHFKRDKLMLFADRYSLFAAAAASEAIEQAGLAIPFADPYRAACIIGSARSPAAEVRLASRLLRSRS